MIIASVTIDLKKIKQERIYKGKRGQDYYTFNVEIYDERDNFDNDVKCVQVQSKEERAAKEPKEKLGYGKVFYNHGTRKNET